MTREADVVQSLVDLADTLVADYDVVDLLTGLADRCVRVLGVDAAGVMLASATGELRLVASSSEAMRVLELFELQASEGPCLDAFRTGEAVAHESLRPGSGRWPQFSTVAFEAGFRSALAMPLRLRENTIGAAQPREDGGGADGAKPTFGSRARSPTSRRSVSCSSEPDRTPHVNEQLSHALTSRVVIEQAKGVVFERAGIEMSDAFNRLRSYARGHNLRLTDVARAAIDGTLDPEAWAPTPRSTSAPSGIHYASSTCDTEWSSPVNGRGG